MEMCIGPKLSISEPPTKVLKGITKYLKVSITLTKLPIELREQLKRLVSEMTDETFDLVVNLSGKYLGKKKIRDIKRKVELEVSSEIEKAMARAYQIGINLQNEYQNKELDAKKFKESFYSITDSIFKPFDSDIPDDVHALDYFFQIVNEIHKEFRFDMPYLFTTKYSQYLNVIEELTNNLKKEGKLGKAFSILFEFRKSNDMYIIVQVTLQKLISYYQFLQTDYSLIKKKHVNKYLEIYEELSGFYEKFLSLVTTLIHLLNDYNPPEYETVRKKGLYENIQYIKKTGWTTFSYEFNRNIRNAIVHKTYKVDILKEEIDFIDRTRTLKLSFQEIQNKTRELSALILLFPHVFISIFCAGVTSFKEQLNSRIE